MTESYIFTGPYRKDDSFYEVSEAFLLAQSLDICQEMTYVREIASIGLKARSMKLRQPLAKAFVIASNPFALIKWHEIFLQEWNIKFLHIIDIRFFSDDRSKSDVVIFDETLTEELKEQGWLAEFKRAIQNFRKKAGLQIEDKPLANFVCDRDTIQKYLFDVCKTLNVVYTSEIETHHNITIDNIIVHFGMKLKDEYIKERK